MYQMMRLTFSMTVLNILVVIVQHRMIFGHPIMTLSALALILDGSISKRPEPAGCFLFLPLFTDRQEMSVSLWLTN